MNLKDATVMKLHRRIAALCCLVCPAAFAAVDKNDYAQGIRIDALSDRPLIELLLPDSVYRTATRSDLGDLRVFNADGLPVPHAFCSSPETEAPVITQESLPVFELQAAPHDTTNGAKVEVQTAGGTQVRVEEGGARAAGEDAAGATKTFAHIMDARGVTDALRSIQFDWQSPDGASEAHVGIESSEDLDRWQTVVAASTLLRVKQGDQQLQRQTIPLPLRQYQYLRATRIDGGPPLQIASVVAERVATPQAIEPQWFAATAAVSTEANVLQFDAARAAPVTYARLLVPQNSSVRINLSSRADEKAPWLGRWSGEVYSILANGEHRTSAPAEFSATSDRYWRVQFAGQGSLAEQSPSLELGYRPARLRFLAQGSGPYMLAYGSRRAEPTPSRQCGTLLADVAAKDLGQLIGEASLLPAQPLGGELALKALPKKTPVRLFVLWGALIVGVGVLVAMALALLKRVNGGQTPAG